jgi:hypothetical protein
MRKIWKKFLSVLGIAALTVIVLAFILFTVFGNRALKIGIETGATSALRVGVSLDDVNLSILKGTLELSGLKIENPAGYQHPEFLTLDKAMVALKISSLLSDTIEIEKIQMDNIQLTIEQKDLMTNNLEEILNALPKSEEKAPQPEASQKTEQKAGKQLLIRELVINGVEVKVKPLPTPGKVDTIPLRLNPIVMKDLGSDKPLNTAELSAKILKAIAGGITEQGKDLLPMDIINSIGEGLAKEGQKVLEMGVQTFEKATGQTGKILEGTKDVGKQATDALKGIFPKKEK